MDHVERTDAGIEADRTGPGRAHFGSRNALFKTQDQQHGAGIC